MFRTVQLLKLLKITILFFIISTYVFALAHKQKSVALWEGEENKLTI